MFLKSEEMPRSEGITTMQISLKRCTRGLKSEEMPRSEGITTISAPSFITRASGIRGNAPIRGDYDATSASHAGWDESIRGNAPTRGDYDVFRAIILL